MTEKEIEEQMARAVKKVPFEIKKIKLILQSMVLILKLLCWYSMIFKGLKFMIWSIAKKKIGIIQLEW